MTAAPAPSDPIAIALERLGYLVGRLSGDEGPPADVVEASAFIRDALIAAKRTGGDQ